MNINVKILNEISADSSNNAQIIQYLENLLLYYYRSSYYLKEKTYYHLHRCSKTFNKI